MEKTYGKEIYEQAAADTLKEVLRAKTLFPDFFVNGHEGYAVILEELDELWDEVKKNQRDYDLKAQRKEAIQCAAMCIRFAAELTIEEPNDEPSVATVDAQSDEADKQIQQKSEGEIEEMAEKEYPDHLHPNEYHYPNLAVKKLQRLAFISGYKTAMNNEK